MQCASSTASSETPASRNRSAVLQIEPLRRHVQQPDVPASREAIRDL
jgi:hypothetical protein